MARRKAFKQLNPGLEAHCELVELIERSAGEIASINSSAGD